MEENCKLKYTYYQIRFQKPKTEFFFFQMLTIIRLKDKAKLLIHFFISWLYFIDKNEMQTLSLEIY